MPSVPTCRMVSKALSRLLNEPVEESHTLGPDILVAALELLLRLNSTRSLCLNLLFNTAEDTVTNVPVTVSCAFKLHMCSRRLAHELRMADTWWDSTQRGTSAEREAEAVLANWLHVGELLVRLCQTVLVYCPTVSVFLAVMLPTTPERIDADLLRGILGDVCTALGSIKARRRAEAIPLRAAALTGDLRALHQQLLDTDAGPPPTSLLREDLNPPPAAPANDQNAGAGSGSEDDVLDIIVGIFSAASDLEEDAEWHRVACLEATEGPTDDAESLWEFDAPVQRRKRQAVREKAEAEKKAKRLKHGQRGPDLWDERGRESRGYRRRAGDSGGDHARGATSRASARHVDDIDKPERNKQEQPAADGAASAATPRAPTANGVVVAMASPQAESAADEVLPPEPVDAAESLQKFLTEHPEYMRVLQNPTKTLGDPRVKTMFMKDLQNYPAVQTFLASKGLVLG